MQKQLCPSADVSSLLKGTAGRRHSDPAVSASSDGLRGRVSARSVLKSASHMLSLERKGKMFICRKRGKREGQPSGAVKASGSTLAKLSRHLPSLL